MTKKTKQETVYNEDLYRVEFWSTDDVEELKTELGVEYRQQTTDFRNTTNIWNSDDFN